MNIQPIVISVLGTLLLGIGGIVFGLWLSGLDRLWAARMQARIGPPVRQPFLDMAKLMTKQNIIPANAIPWLFNGAPLVALASAITLLLYIPLAALDVLPALDQHGDLVLIVYLLTLPALAMVAGGLASGSPYATIGAQREMVTMIAYELPLATTVIAFAWKLTQAGSSAPFSLAAIAATPVWGLVGPVGFMGLVLLLATMILVVPAELGRIPFDAPEAETEIAGGLIVEYSGRNLALLYLSLAVKTVAVLSLLTALFFPWSLTTLLGWTPSPAVAAIVNALFYLFKILLLLFFSVSLIRISVARLRINEIVNVYWKSIGALALLGLGLLIADAYITRC